MDFFALLLAKFTWAWRRWEHQGKESTELSRGQDNFFAIVFIGGMLNKFSGESAFALISLLGASIMPHNFYLHSSIVQILNCDYKTNVMGTLNMLGLARRVGAKFLLTSTSEVYGDPLEHPQKETYWGHHLGVSSCYDEGKRTAETLTMDYHRGANVEEMKISLFRNKFNIKVRNQQSFQGELCVRTIFLPLFSYSAANVSYSTGLLLLTFPDTLSLLDQVFRSSVAPFTIMLVTFISNQVTPLTWDLGRQAVVHYLEWHPRLVSLCDDQRAEGLYQLLILTQVVVALVLPSSVIPLFRLMEFLSLGTFIGLFVIEMIFGNSDWYWGSSVSTPYVFLLIAASLISLSHAVVSSYSTEICKFQVRCSGILQTPMPEPYLECNQLEGSSQKQEGAFHVEKSLVSHPYLSTKDPDQLLPESLLNFEKVHHLATIDEGKSETTYSAPAVGHPEVSVSAGASSANDRDDGDSWEEPEEAIRENTQSFISDGPGSYKSLSEKLEDTGIVTGSLPRLAEVLNEFWWQLFGYHGMHGHSRSEVQKTGYNTWSGLIGESKTCPSITKSGKQWVYSIGECKDTRVSDQLAYVLPQVAICIKHCGLIFDIFYMV
uniref:UDP-glucuronate decarboxylase n=1 Tax=Solanum lycopersicum TaxID=4081 RepID=A0A3Q7HXL7_SOLLC